MTSGLEGVRGLVEEIAHQKPEKPDYWNSCSQCERNIDAAQEALAALPTPPADAEQRATHVRHIGGGLLALYRGDDQIREIGITPGWDFKDRDEFIARYNALTQQPEPKPEARGVVDEVRSERAWPAIGNLYLVKIGGVLQHEVFMFDQGDCEPGGSAPPFWSRDGLDDCPEFDPHKDQWISLDEIDAALTGERNG